jgi:hypothetical protein
MILALVTEPFTQQILTYHYLATPAGNMTASISATSVFSTNGQCIHSMT